MNAQNQKFKAVAKVRAPTSARAPRRPRSEKIRAPIRHVALPGYEIRQGARSRRETVTQFLERMGWNFVLPTICVVNGKPLLRKRWRTFKICAKDEVVFLSRPLGGRGGTGKSVLGLVAIIALSAFAPWAGATLFGTGTFAAALFGGALAIGGALLINMLIKPKAGGQNGEDTQRLYSLSAQGNLARLLQPIPVGYGRLKEAPDFASTPWSEFDGNDQYLNVLFAIGCGKYAPEKIYIDDTELWDSVDGYNAAFTDVEHQFYGPGEDVDLFPVNVVQAVEVNGQTLPGGTPGAWLGGFVANGAGTKTKALAIDVVFPGGCFGIDSSSGNLLQSIVTIECEVRTVNDAGAPLSAFSNVFTKTFTFANRNPIRQTVKVETGPARYEVRLRRTSAALSNSDGSNELIWAGLRSFIEGPQSFPGVTTLAIRMKATSQLSETSAKRFGVLRTRILSVWDADLGEFVEEATRNPFWALYDAATNADYGARRPLSKVDFQTIYDAAQAADERGDTFDFTFSSAVPVPEAFDTIIKPALSRHRWAGDVLTLVRDEWKDTRNMLLTDREIIRGSLRVEWQMNTEDSADAVVVEYYDEETWRVADVQYPPNNPGGIPPFVSTTPSRVRIDGVVKREKAFELAARLFLQAQYRRTTITLDTEHDGRMLGFGSTVFVQTELPASWGYGGEVTARASNTLTISPAPTWAPSGQHYIMLRDKTGKPFGPVKVSKGATANLAVLNNPDLSLVESDQGKTLADVLDRADGAEPPSFSLGIGDQRERPCIVMKGQPQGDKVTLTLAVDDIRVHSDDLGTVPAPPLVPALSDNVAPVVVGLTANFRQGVAEPILDASWWPARGAQYYVAQVSYDAHLGGAATWTPVYEGQENRFSVIVDRASLRLRVQAVGTRQGAFSFVDVEAPTIVIAPGTVSQSSLEAGLRDYVTNQVQGQIENIDSIVQLIASTVVQALSKIDGDKRVLRSTIEARAGAAFAAISEVRTVVATTTESVADLTTSVEAEFDEKSAQILASQTAIADINGRLGAQWTVTLDVHGYASGFKALNDGATSAFVISADVFQIAWPGITGGGAVPVFQIANVAGSAKLAFRGDMFADGIFTARHMSSTSVSAIFSSFGTMEAGIIKSANGKYINDLTNCRELWSD